MYIYCLLGAFFDLHFIFINCIPNFLDHLRAALDYCAQQIWTHFSNKPQGAKVYFPIAAANARESDFLSLMNRRMPGVATASTKAYNAFKGFQAFAKPANAWLPELATLVNQTKHDHLQVASMPQTVLNISHREDGTMLLSFAPGHEPKRGTPWMKINATDADLKGGGSYEVVFLQLKDIKMELRLFLREAIAGVDWIVADCGKLIP
jgi:hypothetical protein